MFDYTVSATDYSSDLAITAVTPNGAIIKDSHGTLADLAGAAEDLGLDINAAVVTAVTASPTGEVSAGQEVQLTLSSNIRAANFSKLP